MSTTQTYSSLKTISTSQMENEIKLGLLLDIPDPMLFFGRPGIGKTEEMIRIAHSITKNDDHVFRLDGSQMAYQEIHGLSYVNPTAQSADTSVQKASYLIFDDLEKFISSDKYDNQSLIVCVIDELSSFDPDDQRTLLNTINDGITPKGIQLPKDKILFLLAANPSPDQRGFAKYKSEAAVHPVEQAIVTRCSTYVIEYNCKDFIDYANKTNMHPVIPLTLTLSPEIFEMYADESIDTPQVPVPRTLHKLSNMLLAVDKHNTENPDDRITVSEAKFASYVGVACTTFYTTYKEYNKNNILFTDLVNPKNKTLREKFKSYPIAEKSIYLISNIKNATKLGVTLADEKVDEILFDLLKDTHLENAKSLANIMYQETKKCKEDEEFNGLGHMVMSWIQTTLSINE